MTIARSIDDAVRLFAASERAHDATESQLDALALWVATWPWPLDYVPSTDDLATILKALCGCQAGRPGLHDTLPGRPKSARAATKVAG
jgi:hypothetical protein